MGYRDYNTGIGGCCYECTEKYEACHDYCEKYLTTKREYEKKKEAIRQAKKEARIYDDYKLSRVIKERRKGQNQGKKYKWEDRRG